MDDRNQPNDEEVKNEEKSMDYKNWPNDEEVKEVNGGKPLPHKSFVRRFTWQIISIVSVLLVIILTYTNISLLLNHQTISASTITSNTQPASSTQQTPTPQQVAGDTTPTEAPTPTPAVQAALPCIVQMSTWTDGSSDWKVLNGVLLNDASNGNWDSASGPTIVAPCQLGNAANYAVETKIKVTSIQSYPCFEITVRGNPLSGGWQGYKAGIGDCGNTGNARISGPDYNNDEQMKDAAFDPGTTTHTYRVEVKDNTITFFIDGGQILNMTDNRYLTGAEVGLWCRNVQLEVLSFQVTAL